ncbi:hypothetical protein [Rhizohabitans arisaemae]|uniref:hypothetical protein n=1 Tax=Rhizohabitans arisaemae TaxID=2720610 RepID=UPI0024B2334B|nr:hypothetical protein [Rhizohabitans arisaemae]
MRRTPESPLPLPPLVEYRRRPVFLRARRRTEDGRWWALLSWQESSPSSGRHWTAERWVDYEQIQPVEGQDYRSVPTVQREDP